MKKDEIISHLPYEDPFLFVTDIDFINENGVTGHHTFSESSDFYQGHFKHRPITPGVILTETMAQIGLVAFGIYLTNIQSKNVQDIQIGMTSTEIDFFIPVLPGETVIVVSEKEYFRFNKLKCVVQMFNEKNELICRGKIAGMIKK
tara:strand:+ start:628 stop:1065 length:438 start_codon:yes stop_codon:yes gene_type:complete